MVNTAINNLVQNLNPRQKEVLADRFGLVDGKKKTLATIGERYGITRERIRQIEKEALEIIKAQLVKEQKEIGEILKLIDHHLNNLGGLRRSDLLLQELKTILRDNHLHQEQLRFLSEIAGQPLYWPDDFNFHSFWYSDRKNFEDARRFVFQLKNLLNDKKEEILTGGRFHFYFIKTVKTHQLTDFTGINYLSISKHFGINPFGDLGLSHWEEINPKDVKGKIYLILKKQDRPLHFREITKTINKAGFNRRKALPQTVHNELIKDPRFVLVGRGIYGLREHGFIPGTTQEIIAKILKENGPLFLPQITNQVLKQRRVKENTIVLNLQNKKYFRKMEDGEYRLK